MRTIEAGDASVYVETLAREAGVSERSVQNGLRMLERRGIIEVSPGTKRGSGEQGANVYRFVGGARNGLTGVQEVHPWGAGGAPISKSSS